MALLDAGVGMRHPLFQVTNEVQLVIFLAVEFYSQGYHFSGNLEMSGNSAKMREKAQSQGKVREFV